MNIAVRFFAVFRSIGHELVHTLKQMNSKVQPASNCASSDKSHVSNNRAGSTQNFFRLVFSKSESQKTQPMPISPFGPSVKPSAMCAKIEQVSSFSVLLCSYGIFILTILTYFSSNYFLFILYEKK